MAEKGVREAREAYEAALARYQEQVGTNFDVLDASSNLTRAQSSLTGSRADYLTALSQLLYRDGRIPPGSSTALIFYSTFSIILRNAARGKVPAARIFPLMQFYG